MAAESGLPRWSRETTRHAVVVTLLVSKPRFKEKSRLRMFYPRRGNTCSALTNAGVVLGELLTQVV